MYVLIRHISMHSFLMSRFLGGGNQMLGGIQVQRDLILIGRQWLGPRIWVEKSLNDAHLTSIIRMIKSCDWIKSCD